MTGAAPEYDPTTRLTSIRAINRARIIALIRRHPGVTRADVSRLTLLSKGTISNHVADLLAEGLLYEEHKGEQQRNVGLRLNRDAGRAIGIELWPGACRGVLTDMTMKPLKHAERQLDSTSVEEAVAGIVSLTEELLRGFEQACVGLVIGVPGPTDAEGQTLVFSEGLGWSDVPLAQRLGEKLAVPVALINRVRAGALGERWHGAGLDVDDLIYVSVSSGIGMGVLIDGQLLTGTFNNGGELGHTTMLIDGEQCVCGNHGCLETVASVPAIVRAVQERREGADQLTFQDVVAAARGGDALVVEEVIRASRYIGIAVANLINLYNPRLVILGGQLLEIGPIVVDKVRRTAQRRAFPLSYAGVRIVASALGADSVGIGACALAVKRHISATVVE